MQLSPVVSIVMPLYNSQDFVREAITSIVQQTFDSWEMVVIDDQSTDRSFEVAKEAAGNDARIKFFQLSVNSGPAIARNQGIRNAKGRYIAFIDSDDVWLPNKLEVQVSFMLKNRIAFSYAAYEKIDESGGLIDTLGVPSKVSYSDLLKCCYVGCLTAMYDTDFTGKIYMPDIRKRQDLGLWLRVLSRVDFAYGLQQPLAKYRLRKSSVSSNKFVSSAYTWQLYRDVEKLSILKSIYYFSNYAVRGLLRKKYPDLARRLGVLHKPNLRSS